MQSRLMTDGWSEPTKLYPKISKLASLELVVMIMSNLCIDNYDSKRKISRSYERLGY